jgi:hypothetical protein
MELQEVATCCRMSVRIMGSGSGGGPGWAQVNVDTMFVRDGDFLYDLAKEMVREGKDVVSIWAELRRDNKLADAENVSLRRARSEAASVASDVVDLLRGIEKKYPRRWAVFQKMIKKQTVRKIMRSIATGDRLLAKEDLDWCKRYIVAGIGAERLERLLTLRDEMA